MRFVGYFSGGDTTVESRRGFEGLSTLYQSLEGNKEYGARMEQMYFILYVNVRTY